MTAHTPGPWKADWLDDENGWVLDSQDNYLATVVTHDSEGRIAPLDQQVANAALMAAAPDLHAACAVLLDPAQDRITEARNLARAAMARLKR